MPEAIISSNKEAGGIRKSYWVDYSKMSKREWEKNDACGILHRENSGIVHIGIRRGFLLLKEEILCQHWLMFIKYI